MKIKINTNSIIIFFILLPYLWPAEIRYMYLTKITDFICGSQGAILSVFICLIWGRKKLLNKVFNNTVITSIIIVFMLFLFSTLFNGYNNYIEYLKTFVSIFTLCICFFVAYYKGSEKNFWDIYIFCKLIVLILSFLLFIQHPNGIEIVYRKSFDGNLNAVGNLNLWGDKNNLCFQFLPLLFAMIIREERFHQSNSFIYFTEKLKIILVTLLLEFIAILNSTSTGAAAFAIFLLLYIFKNNKIVNSFLNGKIIGFGYLLLTVMLVIIQSQGFLAQVISVITHRTIGFTGRTGIWKNALVLISESPIIGYGKDAIIPQSGYMWYAHNFMLDIMIQGGIIALVLYIIMYFVAFVSKKTFQSNSINICLCTFMCIQIFESLLKTCPFFYLLFLMPTIFSKSRKDSK